MIDLTELFKNSTFITILIISIVVLFLIILLVAFKKTKDSRLQKLNTKELDNFINNETKEEISTPITIEDTNTSKENVVVESNSVKSEISEPIIIIDEENNKEDVVDTLVKDTKDDKVLIPKEENNIKVEEIKEKNNDLVYAPIELDRNEAREELEKLTKELEIRAEIEKQNALNKDIKNEDEQLTMFEKEQEENAIISLDELMSKANDIYTSNEVVQYEDEGNEPISLDDLRARWEQEKAKINKIEESNKEEVVEIKPEEQEIKKVVFPTMERISKFENSPIISPVYGIEKTEDSINSNELQLENTADYEKFDEEIRKTNEFIATLKELQKKLD